VWGAAGASRPSTFAERHGLIILIALGESIIANAA
jgi:low temperature requirement protein LtrA